MRPIDKKPPSGKNSGPFSLGPSGIARQFVTVREGPVTYDPPPPKFVRRAAAKVAAKIGSETPSKKTPKRIAKWRDENREKYLADQRERAARNRAKKKAAKEATP